MTTEQVPLSQTCGWVRRIDVRPLRGTTSQGDWPLSPVITPNHIRKYEDTTGSLRAGEIVLFQTGHVDETFRSGVEGDACIANPVNGITEGWPAPSAATIHMLAERGIACVGIDAPTLGGVDPQSAAMTYWALGSRGMVGVEFLATIDRLPSETFFVFAPVRIRDCHGGPGRALALFKTE